MVKHWVILDKKGRWLADRTSAVFDGVPYRWTNLESRAKRMTQPEARRLLADLRKETPGLIAILNTVVDEEA